MGIEDLRWYQWLPIGLALGAAVGGVRLATRERFDDSAARTISAPELNNALAVGLPDGRPAITGLVVHPPRGDGVWWVTGTRVRPLQLHADPNDAGSPLVDVEVRTPFKMPAREAAVWDDLNRSHADFPRTALPPSYAWQDTPLAQMGMWSLGIGALLGGVWPPVLTFLIGAGFGRRTTDPAYDLDAFASDSEPQGSEHTAAATPGDAGQEPPPALSAEPQAALSVKPVPVPTLDSEPVRAAHTASEGPKDYAGQFYPTQVHAPAPKPPGQ